MKKTVARKTILVIIFFLTARYVFAQQQDTVKYEYAIAIQYGAKARTQLILPTRLQSEGDKLEALDTKNVLDLADHMEDRGWHLFSLAFNDETNTQFIQAVFRRPRKK